MLFIFFLGLSYKILIPYGDEPDFEVRIDRVQNSSFLKLLEFPTINIETSCLDSNPVDRRNFFFSFPINCIYENIIKSIIPRSLYGLIFVVLSSFLVLIYSSIAKNYTIDKVFTLSMLFPFNLYLLNSYSDETISNLLSIILFCGLSRPFFLIGFFLLFIIDYDGQFIIISMFLFINYFYKIVKYKYTSFIFIFLSVILFRLNLVSFIQFIVPELYAVKIQQLLNTSEEYRNKYGLLERLLMCIGSFSFMTASGIKIYLQNFFLLYHYQSVLKLIIISKIEILSFISLLVIFISFFPTHTYGKYFIFIIPILFLKALIVFNYSNLLRIVTILNFLVLVNLIIYYIL